MALEGTKTGGSGLGSTAEEWSSEFISQSSLNFSKDNTSTSLTPQARVYTTAPAISPGFFIPTTVFLSSLWKVNQKDNSTTPTPSFSDGTLQPLENEMERLKKERGEIKELAFIPALDAKISRLEKAHQVLKGLEVAPLFLTQVVRQILESKGEESETVDQALQIFQAYKASRAQINGLTLQVAQEYPRGSPLMFELDLSDRNPKIKSYDPGGTSNRQQLSAVDQPPLETLQTFPIFQVYQVVWERSGEEAAHLRLKFAQLREEAETFPFGIDSLQAVQKESERLAKLADPVITQFLTRVSQKRTEQLKQDSSYQDRLAFQETLGGVPIYEMIQTGLASASSGFEVKPEMLLSSREDWKKELEAQRKHLEFQAERFTGDHLIVDVKGWEKSSLKPIIDRLQARMAEIDQQLQNLNPSQTYTPEGLYTALVQETKARVEFQERYLQTLLEIKQYQVAQIPSSVKGDPLAQIGADLKQWSQSDNSLQDRLQEYAKYSEELDHIALGRSIDTKIKMLEAGEGIVSIKDRAMNGMMNAPHEYIAGEKLGDLANESSHLQAARFHYRGVQRLYNEGKFEEASKAFATLEQSVLTVDAQEKVEWSSTFNRYAVGVGIVAGAAAVAYTGGRVAAPVVGEGASLFVNSYLFWTTYNYLEGRSRGVQINPYYDAQKSIGQNSFDTTKNTLLTYGMFRFIGWFGKSYLEGAAKEIAIQAEKELARETVLVEGKVFVQGSAEQILIAERVAVIQERLLTRLQLGVGAFKAEVKGLTAWDMVQQNIELALEKKFDPAQVVWNNLFTPENWEHRVLFLAALKAEGKVSHALGYRQLAEAFANKVYQVRFENLENKVLATQQQIELQLKRVDPRMPEDPVKMLALIRSYEKDLTTQLRLVKEISPELLSTESLQLLAIRAQQLVEVKALAVQYQAEADFRKAYGIKPVSTELAQYSTARGPALVKYWLDRGAKIEIANNGFITVRFQQGEQRYYPDGHSSQAVVEMRAVLASSASDQDSSPFSNLIEGVTAFFQQNPTAQKAGLVGQLLAIGGWDSSSSSTPLWPYLIAGGIVLVIGWTYLNRTSEKSGKQIYVSRVEGASSTMAERALRKEVGWHKEMVKSLGKENFINAYLKLAANTDQKEPDNILMDNLLRLISLLSEGERIRLFQIIEQHGTEALPLFKDPYEYKGDRNYELNARRHFKKWFDLIKDGHGDIETAFKAAQLYGYSKSYFDALIGVYSPDQVVAYLRENYDRMQSSASKIRPELEKRKNGVLYTNDHFLLQSLLANYEDYQRRGKSLESEREKIILEGMLFYGDVIAEAFLVLSKPSELGVLSPKTRRSMLLKLITRQALTREKFFSLLENPQAFTDALRDAFFTSVDLSSVLKDTEAPGEPPRSKAGQQKQESQSRESKAIDPEQVMTQVIDDLIRYAVGFYGFRPREENLITKVEIKRRFNDWLVSDNGRVASADEMNERKLYRSILLKIFCHEDLPLAEQSQIDSYIRTKFLEGVRRASGKMGEKPQTPQTGKAEATDTATPPQAAAKPVKKIYGISSLQKIHREVGESKLSLDDLAWLANSDTRTLYEDQTRLFRLIQVESLKEAGRLGLPLTDKKNIEAYQLGARQYLTWRESPEASLPPVGSSLRPSQIIDLTTRQEVADQIWRIAIGRASYPYAVQKLGYRSLSTITTEANHPVTLILTDKTGKKHQIGQITPGDKSADELFAEMKQRVDEFHAAHPPVITPQEPSPPARSSFATTQSKVTEPPAEQISEPVPAGVSSPPPDKPVGSPSRENMTLYIACLRTFYEALMRSQGSIYKDVLGPLPEILNIMESYHQTGTLSTESRRRLAELVEFLKPHVNRSYITMQHGSDILREFILFLSSKFPIGG